MKIWLDDSVPAPYEHEWVLSVNAAKKLICDYIDNNIPIDYIDVDHDLGEYTKSGGTVIDLMKWIIYEDLCEKVPVKSHSHTNETLKELIALLTEYMDCND